MTSDLLASALIAFTIYRACSFMWHQRRQHMIHVDTEQTVEDRLGSYLINILYVLFYGIAVYQWYRGNVDLTLAFLGTFLIGGSWILRQSALPALGDNYGHEIKMFKNHELVQDGIYRHMRHPLYAGLCMDTLGAALIGSNVFTAVLWAFYMLVIIRRIRREDHALVSKFKDEAEAYQKQVPAIYIPGIFTPKR